MGLDFFWLLFLYSLLIRSQVIDHLIKEEQASAIQDANEILKKTLMSVKYIVQRDWYIFDIA